MHCIQVSLLVSLLYSGTVPLFSVFSGVSIFEENWPDILEKDHQFRFG